MALRLQHVQEVVRGAGSGQLFLVYVMLHGAVAALGYALAAPGMFFTAFWPAAGLLLAACIVLRSEQRWIVLVASIVAEAAIRSLRARSGYSSAGPGVILYVAVVQAVVCGSATMLVERWWRVPLPAGLSKVVRATGVIVLVVTALIAAGAAGLAWYVGRPYPLVLQIWLMSAMLGMIAVTPGILAWWISLAGFAARLDGSRTEFALLFLLTLTATFVVFGDWPDTARYQLLYIHFPLLLWAAMRFPPRYVALIGLAVACMAAGLTSSGQGPFAPANDVFLATLLPMQLFIIAMLSSALLLGVANYERRRSESSLRSYAHALANAEERVRRKTAADLHDGIGQELFGMRMRLEAARRRVTDPSTARLLDENLDTLDDIEKNTRELVQELDPPWIQSLDLDEAVRWLADRLFDRAGLRIETRVVGEVPAIDGKDQAVLFRSIRELLQNIVRHSGSSAASIDLRTSHNALAIVVKDAGRGFDMRFATPGELHGGFGLFSVREQLAVHGAQLLIDTAPGQGCTATIVWPLRDPPPL